MDMMERRSGGCASSRMLAPLSILAYLSTSKELVSVLYLSALSSSWDQLGRVWGRQPLPTVVGRPAEVEMVSDLSPGVRDTTDSLAQLGSSSGVHNGGKGSFLGLLGLVYTDTCVGTAVPLGILDREGGGGSFQYHLNISTTS